jgi:hypothetical protein
MLLLLVTVLGLLLHNSFLPGQILFSNDGPLGRLESQCHHLPEAFTGVWQDLNSVGFREGGAMPNITALLRLILMPIGFSKFYVPLALLILGLGAGYFFRRLSLAPLACVLGGLAATLNSCFFSAACWGVGSLAITIGMVFFALGALVEDASPHRWLRVVLAGLAVGMAVAEGADIGAIFSMFVATFVVYQSWFASGSRVRNVAGAAARISLVAVFAGLVAAQAVTVLVQTQLEGVTESRFDLGVRENPWDWATKWSLPKREALGLAVPGLFGFRMDTDRGGAYWGNAGRDPAWDRFIASGQKGPPPTGFIRYSGGGIYAGELVVLVALWAVLQSLRRKATLFTLTQRRWLWFWLVVAVGSLLFAFGRYAPFYRLLYALPYFSSIRNPTKFLHLLSFALVVLFAYGVDGLARACLRSSGLGVVFPPRGLKEWWAKASRFERYWTIGWLLAVLLSLVAWRVYSDQRYHLVDYLQANLFEAATADELSKFSVGQVGRFVLLLLLAGGLLVLVLAGRFTGPRAKWGGILLGALLVVDLGWANQPWIVYWDYQDKYASNPILDMLRSLHGTYRVTMFPFHMPPDYRMFEQLYRVEWLQHPFPYYNIQSLDVSQMPRSPVDIDAFESTFRIDPLATNTFYRLVRRWELTNTRYLIGPTDTLGPLNEQVDPVKKRFHIVAQFNMVPKPGIAQARQAQDLTATLANNGTLALIEFSGAMPRVSLWSGWQVNTNQEATLAAMDRPEFDPHKTLLVGGNVPDPPVAATPQSAGTVELTRYAPKDLVFTAEAKTPCVMLLNDRFEPNWNVSVDGRRQTVLRCNFLMRGVYLTPGNHTVEFRFQPPVGAIYVSLAASVAGLLLLGVALGGHWLKREDTPVPVAAPGSAPADPASDFTPAPAPASPGPQPKNTPGKSTRKGKRLKESVR